MIKDIVIRETYDKNGEEKTSWNKIGILIDNGDKQYVKLFHIPNVLCSVFEQKKRNPVNQTNQVDQTENIPF